MLSGNFLVVVGWLKSLRRGAIHILFPGTQQLAATSEENVPPKASELSSVPPPTEVEISIPIQSVECVSFP